MNNSTTTQSDPITNAIAAWEPRCFDATGRRDLVVDIRTRVAESKPITENDARLMLAAVSRLVADTIGGRPSCDQSGFEM